MTLRTEVIEALNEQRHANQRVIDAHVAVTKANKELDNANLDVQRAGKAYLASFGLHCYCRHRQDPFEMDYILTTVDQTGLAAAGLGYFPTLKNALESVMLSESAGTLLETIASFEKRNTQ